MWAEIIKLMPVIIGGLIAALAAGIAPTLNHFLQAGRERRARRLQLAMEFVEILYEQEYWTNHFVSAVIDHNRVPEQSPPIHKALALAAIQFPDLLQETKEFSVACTAYEGIFTDLGMRIAQGEQPDPKDVVAKELHLEFLNRRNALVRKVAGRYSE